MVGVILLKKLSFVLIADLFSQVVDPHHTMDVTQPCVPLLSPTEHDDNTHDLLTATSRSFNMTNLQSDSVLTNNNNKSTENGKIHLV